MYAASYFDSSGRDARHSVDIVYHYSSIGMLDVIVIALSGGEWHMADFAIGMPDGIRPESVVLGGGV